MSVFWRKGYAATSTDDLLRAMNIGRQSMYDTFGDKHRLYLEALEKYRRESVAENIRRLRSTGSPLFTPDWNFIVPRALELWNLAGRCFARNITARSRSTTCH
jgi:AcrR family transcriptional regulator